MPGSFISPEGDLERIFVDDYAMIDQFAMTGSLWGWGGNASGRLGDNTIVSKSSPVQTVSGGTNWEEVSCAGTSTAAIKTDGTLWLWGQGSSGQLGDNSTTAKSSPVQTVSGGTNWRFISTNSNYTGSIKTDGTLWLWGVGGNGQLGNNALTNRSSPVQTVSGGTNWKQVSCSDFTAAAIKTDGTLWLWGDGFGGILGDNTTAAKSSPVQTVSGGTNWKQVSVGGTHTASIKTDGTLWLWGGGSDGQLGNNAATSRSSPVQTVSAGTNWKQVVCGELQTAAIKTDGTLWCWGFNLYGRLGDNTTTSRSSPVQTVSGGTNWKEVSSNAGATLMSAIKTDGTLWVWGRGLNGRLGDNTDTDKSSPVQTVAGGTNWKQVSVDASGGAAIYFYDAGDLYPSQ